MLGMPAVPDHLEEVGIAVGSSDVFRRASALACDAQYRRRRIEGERITPFEDDRMMPVVAEVVDIVEGANVHAQRLLEPDASFIDEFDGFPVVLEIVGVSTSVDDELVQMAVEPFFRFLIC